MADRELYWGASDDAATEYRTRDSDPTGGGDFIAVERADGSEVLLQWDDTAGEWVPGGPINMDGQDVTGANLIKTEQLDNDLSDPIGFAASRSFDTEFQNTDTSNRLVYVIVESDGSQTIDVKMEVGEISGSLGRISNERILASDISGITRVTLYAEVAPGEFYEVVTSDDNAASIQLWREMNR